MASLLQIMIMANAKTGYYISTRYSYTVIANTNGNRDFTRSSAFWNRVLRKQYPYLWHYVLDFPWEFRMWGRSKCPRGLRRGPAAANLLGPWARMPPVTFMSVSCEWCVSSGRGLWVGPITRLEESYRVWCGWVWSAASTRMALAHYGLSRHGKEYSGVCYNERMLQRTVFINKIRMLQRTRRNTIRRRSTRVRTTCRAFPLWLERPSSSLLSFAKFTYLLICTVYKS
jgi:hypothetical protein